jgi:hypothetical protein
LAQSKATKVKPTAPPLPPPPGAWESTIRPFLEQRSLLLAVAFVALATLRIVSTWHLFATVGDEPAHLAAGMEYLSKHHYDYDRQHAPLACVMAALGPFLAGARSQNYPGFMQEGQAIVSSQGHPDLTLALDRAGMLPFFFLACFIVYAWTQRGFGKAMAALALGLFTLIPTVLAHAGVGCTDMALTATLGAAFYALVLWAQDPTWKRTVLLGVAVAVAILSRFTALGYLTASAVFALAGLWLSRGASPMPLITRAHVVRFSAAAAITAVGIWAGYLFSFGPVPKWGVSLPAPEFFDGVRTSFEHSRLGHPAFLLGEYSVHGWWYYFPVALLVKTPLGLLVPALAGLWFFARRWREPRFYVPLAFTLGILVPAITSHVNIGLRLILPIYIALSMAAAWAIDQWSLRKPTAILAGALTAWLAVSSLAAHPDYIPYFNLLAGSEPDKILVDSDYDWGQDTKRLAARLQELHAPAVAYYGIAAAVLDYPLLQIYPGLPPMTKIDPIRPAEGYSVISPTMAAISQYGLYYKHPNIKPWYEQIPPREKVGTLLLYYIPPGSLRSR